MILRGRVGASAGGLSDGGGEAAKLGAGGGAADFGWPEAESRPDWAHPRLVSADPPHPRRMQEPVRAIRKMATTVRIELDCIGGLGTRWRFVLVRRRQSLFAGPCSAV